MVMLNYAYEDKSIYPVVKGEQSNKKKKKKNSPSAPNGDRSDDPKIVKRAHKH